MLSALFITFFGQNLKTNHVLLIPKMNLKKCNKKIIMGNHQFAIREQRKLLKDVIFFSLSHLATFISMFLFNLLANFAYIPSSIRCQDFNPRPLGYKSSPLTTRQRFLSNFDIPMMTVVNKHK